MNALDETWKIARAQAVRRVALCASQELCGLLTPGWRTTLQLIALGSTIPGYYVTVFLIDKIGRIPIQLGGFVMMSGLMAILAGAYNQLPPSAFVTLYALTFFFSNFGAYVR